MERLTFDGLFCDICMCDAEPDYCGGGCDTRKQWDRLKAYEDTDMTPSQILDMKEMFHAYRHICVGYTPERLKELVEADSDGRCKIFPLKVGDTVYEPNPKGFISTYTVISFHVSPCSILVGWMLEDGVYSNVNGFELSALGEIVFLTREEAEKALEEHK